MFKTRKPRNKDLEANLKLDKSDIKVLEIKLGKHLLSWGVGVPEKTEKQMEGAIGITPTPSIKASADSKKELAWNFWYNKAMIPDWLTEDQVKTATATNATVVTGSATSSTGTFVAWQGGDIRDFPHVTILPKKDRLTVKKATKKTARRLRPHGMGTSMRKPRPRR